MDVFYEESSVNHNAEKGRKTYMILHIISWVFFFLFVIFAVITFMIIPAGCSPKAGDYTDSALYEQDMSSYLMAVFNCLFMLGIALLFLSSWFLFFLLKRRVNISYDYIFVSGELRIAKIFNINRRKLVERIACEEIIQIGDTDNPSYERLASSPDTKVVYYTRNLEASEGKFFMYILVNNNGKKLLILEARELLLMNILKFVRRGVLESDYVMQEKKQKA